LSEADNSAILKLSSESEGEHCESKYKKQNSKVFIDPYEN
jgi:hypothetical protein